MPFDNVKQAIRNIVDYEVISPKYLYRLIFRLLVASEKNLYKKACVIHAPLNYCILYRPLHLLTTI